MRSSEHNEVYGLLSPPNCRKIRREATAPEALSPEKEAKFAKCEAEEVAKSEANDPVWR